MAKKNTAQADSSLEDAAKAEMIDALNELLAQQDFELSIPYNHLNAGVAQVVENHGKVIAKLQGKIVKGLNKELVGNDNSLESIRTIVLNGLNAHQADMEFLLQQLAVKSGAIKIGDPLEAALIEEATKGAELAQVGTLVLKVAEAVPWLERIAVALEKIASRMSPLEDADTDPETQDDEPLEDSAQALIDQPFSYWKP